jgi:hypothetical protein
LPGRARRPGRLGRKIQAALRHEWEIVATFGHSTKLDEAAVLKLQAAMQKADLTTCSKRFSRATSAIRSSAARKAKPPLLAAPLRKLYEDRRCAPVSRTPITRRRKKKLAKIASHKASA